MRREEVGPPCPGQLTQLGPVVLHTAHAPTLDPAPGGPPRSSTPAGRGRAGGYAAHDEPPRRTACRHQRDGTCNRTGASASGTERSGPTSSAAPLADLGDPTAPPPAPSWASHRRGLRRHGTPSTPTAPAADPTAAAPAAGPDPDARRVDAPRRSRPTRRSRPLTRRRPATPRRSTTPTPAGRDAAPASRAPGYGAPGHGPPGQAWQGSRRRSGSSGLAKGCLIAAARRRSSSSSRRRRRRSSSSTARSTRSTRPSRRSSRPTSRATFPRTCPAASRPRASASGSALRRRRFRPAPGHHRLGMVPREPGRRRPGREHRRG